MGSSKFAILRYKWVIFPFVLVVSAILIFLIIRMDVSAGQPSLKPDSAVIRYRFGGEVITHYLTGIAAITIYRRPEALDAVVFNLKSGKDYVVNADLLVDYELAPGTNIQKQVALNKLYYRYDPYLQGEKQGWHKEWAESEYLKWVGRLPTDAEWLEILNEVTRGMEHPQMEQWIQYSPPAIRHFIETEFLTISGRAPSEDEIRPFYERLLAGDTYEKISKDIQTEVAKVREQ
jgi:hypothetical protein